MAEKEAKARIKINKLLEEAGWRFFDDENGQANIQLEPNVKIKERDIDVFGKDFESLKNGFIDFLLINENGSPLVILEAKKENKSPLDGKEQARRYAKSLNVRFVILSNGNIHYFWDIEYGNPEIITKFPNRESLGHRIFFMPDNKRLAEEIVTEDYIAVTQKPGFNDNPQYQDKKTRSKYLFDEDLRILRPYQIRAIHALQACARKGRDRFLFEMATGTGKTLIAATPKNYLKNINIKELSAKDPRSWERRQLFDTYKTFGCDNGEPTFRYSLINGVKDGCLISPIVAEIEKERKIVEECKELITIYERKAKEKIAGVWGE